jgi:hypothetical protein
MGEEDTGTNPPVLTMALRCKFEREIVSRVTEIYVCTCFLCSEPKHNMNRSGPGTRKEAYLPSTTTIPDIRTSKSYVIVSYGTVVRTSTSESAENVSYEFCFLESVVILENI